MYKIKYVSLSDIFYIYRFFFLINLHIEVFNKISLNEYVPINERSEKKKLLSWRYSKENIFNIFIIFRSHINISVRHI